jgi:hypothetical protein
MHRTALQSASARFIRHTGRARPEVTIEKARRLLGIPIEGGPDEKLARVRLGSYEFRKKGIPRLDLRDPYHLAIALTWPQFLAALLTLSFSEFSLRCALLGGSRIGGECWAV